jgi:hypothetical protein
MKNKSLFLLALLILFAASASLHGQNLFWSTSGLNEGASSGDLTLSPSLGESTTAFLYYTPEGEAFDLFDLDVSWNNPDVVNFTSAAVFNFDITVAGTAIDSRWGIIFEPQVSGNSVTELYGGTLGGGFGVDPSNATGPFIDEGYDPDSEAFLLLAVEFERVGTGGAELQIDTSLFLDSATDINPTFSSLTIQAIPEPSVPAILALVGLTNLMLRRRQFETTINRIDCR